MPRYHYNAMNQSGEPVSGSIEAASEALAGETLAEQGLVDIDLQPELASQTEALTAREGDEFAQRVAALSESEIPLDIGLEAAAREVASRRLSRAFLAVAAELREGKSLPDALLSQDSVFPPHLRELMDTAHQAGRFAEVLSDLTSYSRRRQTRWRQLWIAMLYPFMTLVFAIAITGFIAAVVVPPCRDVFTDFELETSNATQFLFLLHDHGMAILSIVLAIPVVAVTIWILGSPVVWGRFVGSIPLLGPAIYWAGIAEFARVMAMLIRYRLPLPNALRLAAATISDKHIGYWAEFMARRTDAGEPLVRVLETTHAMPTIMVNLARAARKTDDLSVAMVITADVLEGHVEFRLNVLRYILPILVFLFVILMVIVALVGLMGPLVSLLSYLG